MLLVADSVELMADATPDEAEAAASDSASDFQDRAQFEEEALAHAAFAVHHELAAVWTQELAEHLGVTRARDRRRLAE